MSATFTWLFRYKIALNKLLLYFYICVVAFAFACSLLSFRFNYPAHLKIFSVLLGLTLLNEIIAVFLVRMLGLYSNHQEYNVFMLIEFWCYALYYRYITTIRLIKILINIFLVLFPIFWVITIFYFYDGLIYWNSYLIVVGFFFTVMWSAAYCYQLFVSTELIRFRAHTEFWIALGLIIFYTCNLPYLGMYNFLATNYPQLAQSLKKVLQPTDCLMYLLFGYGYICRMINTKKFSPL